MLALSGTVGEHHHGPAAGVLRGVLQSEQQRVIESGIVSGGGGANAAKHLQAIGSERSGAIEVAAIGIEGDAVGAIEGANEIGDGVLGKHETAIHVVAGVEEDEDAGTGERRHQLGCLATHGGRG